jgi:hypothetical protein
VYRAARAVLAGALAMAAVVAAGCADERGPPSVPVAPIFDAMPMCGGDVGVEAGAAADASVAAVDGAAADVAAAGDAPGAEADAPDAGPVDAPALEGGPGSSGPGGKVVLISVDGLRPDAIFYGPAPHLIALACKGAYSWQAVTIDPSLTLPSHASMVSGFPPAQHMIFHNDVQAGFIAVPTVMSVAKQAGKRVVLVVGKQKLSQLVPPGAFDVFAWEGDVDDDVITRAIAEAQVGFDLMFIHLPLVDLVGHAEGWMSPPYLEQVRATDRELGRLLAALPTDTTILVTSDHGGAGYIHWSGLDEDVRIPWIIAGPGVHASRALRTRIHTFDTAATVAHVLGLSLVPEALGRPVLEPWQ